MLEESNRREQTDRPRSWNESSQSVKLQAEKQAPTFYVDPSELPAVLKKARLVAGHSQEMAAEKVGIAKTALNRIEINPSRDQAARERSWTTSTPISPASAKRRPKTAPKLHQNALDLAD